MSSNPSPLADRTAALLLKGYAWLPGLVRRRGHPLSTRLMGRPAVAVRGPEAVRFVYDERHVVRGPALPEPVLSTLFGKGAVHTLDGEAHRVRKAMFLSLLTDPGQVADLTEQVADAWERAVPEWAEREEIVLFDEAAVVLTRAVCRWAGVPLEEADARPLSRDLVAMVDGFATAGPRHWRARRARSRREFWAAGVVEEVRDGALAPPEGSALDVIARHRDADGLLLEPRVAGVELLNVLRPTVAVTWFVSFAGHLLHHRPDVRDRLWADDAAYLAAFVHELRRFYPFAPFVGGRAPADVSFRGEEIPEGGMVLLDLFGQNHDEELWGDPYVFRPERFLRRPVERDELVPQGGGDPARGHRCPGEAVTIALLEALTLRLARLEHEVPEQDLRISLHRVPARPRSGLRITVTGK
ncbi:cytochrome P450 [Streptomyces chilikensis]|uniref:cytochrome P450 n=1 Tax=Streptomyces chilikensis TaxID=1194079 RepID=UPI00140BDDB8|nr:cytochrome P450 [Streptomyces chilikensis]